MTDQNGVAVAAREQESFAPGIEDVVIVPLAAAGFIVARLSRALLTALIRFLDYAFPILLQLARFPLFTLRILGDAVVWLSKGVIRCLPLSFGRRSRWNDRLGAGWAWLRRKISYHAFEEAVHHLFEGGMAWVFRTCRTLSPRAAVLVLIGAVLWFPISFTLATAMHALLLAYAASLPPAMQLLHPFATVIAKTKLLVLPVYPAAWPQAKRHGLVQAILGFGRWFARLTLVRKTGYRYRQIAAAARALAAALARSPPVAGLRHGWNRVSPVLVGAAVRLARGTRTAAVSVARAARAVPLVGTAIARYEAHYDRATDHEERLSARVHGFFARWSVKFTAQYYEAKEREAAAARTHAA